MLTSDARFADETTRRAYERALHGMETQLKNAKLNVTLMLAATGDVRTQSNPTGPRPSGRVNQAARAIAHQHRLPGDWLRQLARLIRRMEPGTTIYAGRNLKVLTGMYAPAATTANGGE